MVGPCGIIKQANSLPDSNFKKLATMTFNTANLYANLLYFRFSVFLAKVFMLFFTYSHPMLLDFEIIPYVHMLGSTTTISL